MGLPQLGQMGLLGNPQAQLMAQGLHGAMLLPGQLGQQAMTHQLTQQQALMSQQLGMSAGQHALPVGFAVSDVVPPEAAPCITIALQLQELGPGHDVM